MAIAFYIIGWLVVLAGAGIVAIAVGGAGRLTNSVPGMEQLGATVFGVAGTAGGLGVMFSGLLVLAIGGVLSRLDRIAYNTGGQ